MATLCSDIVARAQAFSSANGPLTADAGIMLSRIRADQSALYTKAAELNRDFFATTASVTSTSGSSGRTIDLSALTPPLERLLRVTRTSDGVDLAPVDPLDTAAELPPRYTTQGLRLLEVGSDWGASGTVSVTVLYVQAPTDIDPAGSLTQAVSLPDRWTDILVVNLAQYLHHMDVGRDPAEGERLQALSDARVQDFMNYLTHVGGVEARRFVIPTPMRPEE